MPRIFAQQACLMLPDNEFIFPFLQQAFFQVDVFQLFDIIVESKQQDGKFHTLEDFEALAAHVH